MSSSPNPFEDPKSNDAIPSPPPPRIPARSASRPSTPQKAKAIPHTPVSGNPFRDPANVIPESSTRPRVTNQTQQTGWSNNPYHSTSPTKDDNKDNKASRPSAKQTVSFQTQPKPTTGSGSGNLVSYNLPFAPSYPHSHDVNKPSSSIYTTATPIKESGYTPESYRPQPRLPESHPSRSDCGTPEPRSHNGVATRDFTSRGSLSSTPTPPKFSRSDEDILYARTKAALAHGKKHMNPIPLLGTPSNKSGGKSIDREDRVRHTVIQQNQKLEQARQKVFNSIYPESPTLKPSPRLTNPTRNTPGIHRYTSSASGNGLIAGGRKDRKRKQRGDGADWKVVLKDWKFWLGVVIGLCGFVSSGAAIASIVKAKKDGEPASHVAVGLPLWLTISLLVCIIAFGVSSIILCIKVRCCTGCLANLGLEELGLAETYGRNESAVQQGFRDREAADREILHKLARVRERERQNMAHGEGESSRIQTNDPTWQALYTPADRLPGLFEPSRRGPFAEDQDGIELSENIGRGRIRAHTGADTLLSGSSRGLREFNETDIGNQSLTPSRRGLYTGPSRHESVNDDGFVTQRTQGTFSHFNGHKLGNGRERFPYSKPPGGPSTQQKKKNPPSRLNIPDASPSSNSFSAFNRHVPKARSPLGAGEDLETILLTPKSSTSPYATAGPSNSSSNNHNNASTQESMRPPNNRLRSNSLSQDFTINSVHSFNSLNTTNSSSDHNATATTLQTWSPLENLARECNTPELHKLSEHERTSYFMERREENEEKGRRVRMSLDRSGGSDRGSRLLTHTTSSVQGIVKGFEKRKEESEKEKSRSPKGSVKGLRTDSQIFVVGEDED